MQSLPTPLPLRRSPLYRYHQQLDARFVERSDGLLVSQYGNDLAREVQAANSLAIADLTALQRIGFRGVDTEAWLESQGLCLPASPNAASLQQDGVITARLSHTESLLLDDLRKPAKVFQQLRNNWSMDIDKHTYLLERGDSHGCFALSGEHVPELLSKVCAVDMRLHKFPQYSVAQTSVARSNSIVVRVDFGPSPGFLILSDLSTTEFVWQGLLDAMLEFNGKAIGITALTSLTQ